MVTSTNGRTRRTAVPPVVDSVMASTESPASTTERLDPDDRQELAELLGNLDEANIQVRIATALLAVAERRYNRKYKLHAAADRIEKDGAIFRGPVETPAAIPTDAPAEQTGD